MSLIETKNTLNDCYIGSVRLENEHYRITVSYCGDYKTARAENKIEQNYISVRCECIDNNLIIANVNASIYISMSKSYIPDVYNADDWHDIERQMKNALETVTELQKIVDDYFCI